VFVALLAGILLIPTPLRVQGTLVLMAARPKLVYAEVPGRLVEMKVRDGDWVPKGTVLATLSNPEKIRERMEIQEQQAVNFHKALWYGHSSDRDSRALSRQHQQMATDSSRPSTGSSIRSASSP
jgi:putative peptide zinc metalloprotease protein